MKSVFKNKTWKSDICNILLKGERDNDEQIETENLKYRTNVFRIEGFMAPFLKL